MPSDSLVHVKLESSEALESKRSFLSAQINLLKVARTIKSYSVYRNRELELKIRLHKEIKELRAGMSKLHRILPKPKIPEAIRKQREHHEKSHERKSKTQKTEKHDSGIESQLQEIQRRLNELQTS